MNNGSVRLFRHRIAGGIRRWIANSAFPYCLLVACANSPGCLQETSQPRSAPASGSRAGAVLDASPPGAAPVPQAVSDEEYSRRIDSLRRELDGQGYTILLEKPFVVIGNEPAEQVQRHSEGTIRWAVQHLKARYFAHDPGEIIEIWLFRDRESYGAGCERLMGEPPGTPFGFYSAAKQKLIMNISTGGGTLVHEIVHPYIAANFPGCPSWFNEGLASLYEQCGEVDGVITGYTNWRLRGLQLAIENSRLPDFATLLGTSTREFYDDPHGTNYAQARYLCLYLQEAGRLQEFYRAFQENLAEDPDGLKTLQKTLSIADLAAFQADWQAWAMNLKF